MTKKPYNLASYSQENRTAKAENKSFLRCSGSTKEASLITPLKSILYYRQACIGITLSYFFLIIPIQASAQQKFLSTEVIVERINSLEKDNQRLREGITDLKRENDKLNSEYKELKASLKEYEPFKFWTWILGALGIGSILGLAWMCLKFIPTRINKQVDEIINKIFTDRRDDFLSLLKEYDFEKLVKQRHRIVLLSHRNGSDDYQYRMLNKNGFKVYALTKLEQLQDAQFTSEDIIVINNDGNHWAVEQVQDFINTLPNYFFYFGKGIINTTGDRQERFAAANFRTQFIGNLMNVLKYSHHQK